MSEITFYISNNDERVLDKTLSDGTVVNCDMRTDIDIYSPTLLLKNFNPQWNYYQWNGRYYFIRDYDYTAQGIYRVGSHIDVLMTYNGVIKKSQVYLRQTTKTEPYFNGGDYNHLETYETDVYKSTVTLPKAESTILITVGLSGDIM